MKIDKSSTVVALDPGIRGCGVSVFDAGRLVDAMYVKNAVKKGNDINAVQGMAQAVEESVLGWLTEGGKKPDATLVCEWPRIYTASKSRGDNNDLLALVGVDCAVAALLVERCVSTDLYSIFPYEWKGQLKHEAVEARVESRLDERESAVLGAALKLAGKTYGHNVTDAVGIGLHAVGRFERRRVIAR